MGINLFLFFASEAAPAMFPIDAIWDANPSFQVKRNKKSNVFFRVSNQLVVEKRREILVTTDHEFVSMAVMLFDFQKL